MLLPSKRKLQSMRKEALLDIEFSRKTADPIGDFLERESRKVLELTRVLLDQHLLNEAREGQREEK